MYTAAMPIARIITTQKRGTSPQRVAAAPDNAAAAAVVEVCTVGVRANPMMTSKKVMNMSPILLAIFSTTLLYYYIHR